MAIRATGPLNQALGSGGAGFSSGCSSAVATRRVIEKSITTTTSIMTVTARTTVVNGPFALSSEMMAMADEGERATERHAMRRAAAVWPEAPRAPKNGINVGPRRSITTRQPE